MSSPPAPSRTYSQVSGAVSAEPLSSSQKTVPELLHNIAANLQDITRGEFRLARAEVREEARKAVPAARVLAAGLFAGLYAAGFLLLAAVYGLATIFESWFAALLVGVILAIVAATLISAGLTRFRQADPGPEKTIHSFEENAPWAKERIK